MTGPSPYVRAEPYENLSYGDLLHDDGCDESLTIIFIGTADWEKVYGSAIKGSGNYDDPQFVIEWWEGTTPHVGWMPYDTPYWHRKSQCRYREGGLNGSTHPRQSHAPFLGGCAC